MRSLFEMNHEAYCADLLRVTEREAFLSIGDGQLAQLLNPSYKFDMLLGKSLSLPDLLSITRRENQIYYRLREVKYKLEKRLVEKALKQLQSGVIQMKSLIPDAKIDRLEIVIPLKGRRLKEDEVKFLGPSLAQNRFSLSFDSKETLLIDGEKLSPVSVLIL